MLPPCELTLAAALPLSEVKPNGGAEIRGSLMLSSTPMEVVTTSTPIVQVSPAATPAALPESEARLI